MELVSCKDDEEGVGWLDIKAIAMTVRNDKRRNVRSQLLYVRTGTGNDGKPKWAPLASEWALVAPEWATSGSGKGLLDPDVASDGDKH